MRMQMHMHTIVNMQIVMWASLKTHESLTILLSIKLSAYY